MAKKNNLHPSKSTQTCIYCKPLKINAVKMNINKTFAIPIKYRIFVIQLKKL